MVKKTKKKISRKAKRGGSGGPKQNKKNKKNKNGWWPVVWNALARCAQLVGGTVVNACDLGGNEAHDGMEVDDKPAEDEQQPDEGAGLCRTTTTCCCANCAGLCRTTTTASPYAAAEAAARPANYEKAPTFGR